MMKHILSMFALVLLLSSAAVAAGPKDYQVTGPVLDVTDDVITVEKGKEKWEIGRDKNTKVSGDLKKGSRVTVHYKMTATSVDVKDSGKAKTKGEEKTKAESTAKPTEKKVESKTK
jgi:ribosomal 50S subunit-recycling heat shock protein